MALTPLGALDALFLHLETPATPMHVGALNLLDPPDGATELFDAISSHVTARVSASPVLTRKLRPLPLSIANPVWSDAGDIDLSYHVRRVRLPAAGSHRQLEAAVARLHARLLDRHRPLWQFYLIEGLAGGGCALYSKVHHAAVDGAAGVALAQALFDSSPAIATPAPQRRVGPGADLPSDPGAAQLLGAALLQNGRAGIALARKLPALARAVGGVLGSGRAAGLPGWARRFGFAPPTLLNRSIDSGRSIATLSVSLAQVRSLAAAQAVTVNDVVLAVVGGALRRYLAEHGGLPSRSLLAAMPVSLRESGDTRMNTQAWMMPASLATDVADPVERLHVIHAAADAAKSLTRDIRPAVDVSLPSIGQPWLLTSAAALYGAAGLAERLPRLANIVVSNVPGPSLPLYLAGARLCSYWPLSIVEHGLGLNVTVMRYVESLDFGLVAARKLVPDLAPLMRAMRDALEELVAATLAPARPTPKRVNTRGVSSKASGRGEGNAAGRIRPRAAPDPSRAPRNTR